MKPSLLAAVILFAVTTPIGVSAQVCGEATHIQIQITAAPGGNYDYLPPGEYCFDVTYADDVASKPVKVQWVHERNDQPFPSAPAQSTKKAGTGDTEAEKELAAAIKDRDDKKSRLIAAEITVEAERSNTLQIQDLRGKGAVPESDVSQASVRLRIANGLVEQLKAAVTTADNNVAAAEAKVRANARYIPPEIHHAVVLGANSKAIMKVWIDAPNTNGDPTQTYTYEVEPGGKWQLGYGFLFMPGRDKEYVSRATDQGFEISRKSRRGALTFAPGLIWSWYPNPSRTSNCVFEGFTCGFAAGIAADSSSPILFAGVQGTYHQNISFNLGVAVHQEKRLAGEYHEGQSLTESIDSDTLNKSVYRPNLYFGVSFRFDKSPF